MHATLRHEGSADATRLQTILKQLARAYGLPPWIPHHDPLAELIATILSQNTSDVNSDRAYAALRAAYPSWDEVLRANLDDFATAIRSGGLATLKSRRIQEILRTIQARHGHVSLDFLMDMPMPAARAVLADFPGVGPKTIACVLLFACGHPAFPVDTHIYRVTTRLGLLPAGCTAERAHVVLEPHIPSAHVYSAHVNLIRHGRTICKARQPDCRHCCLRTLCPYPQQAANMRVAGQEASASARVRGGDQGQPMRKRRAKAPPAKREA
jgi:endonuclease III